jgi:hypothetical protein
MAQDLDTHQRALQINVDRSIFGTFAEIGGGQEVARWFFRVGGAAGTVAKTISAYDMAVSDAIYGKSGRYVSRERLLAMLDHEYALLLERLDPERGADTRFFVFADTVAARNYAGTNECHGWMGLRFQAERRGEPCDVLLHVNMMDPTNLLQQQALGILGVNLVYAAFHDRDTPEHLLKSIVSELSLDRIEVDVVVLSGAAFRDVDPQAVGLLLVRHGLGNVVVLGEGGRLVTPSEILRKRPVVLERRAFGATDVPSGDVLESAARKLSEERGRAERPPLSLFEMSVEGGDVPDDVEVLRRAGELGAFGLPVAISRYPQWYRLSEYLRRYTKEPIRFAVGVVTLVEVFERGYYENLVGGLLEALGKLLAENVRVYVHPMPAAAVHNALTRTGLDHTVLPLEQDGLASVDRIRLAPPVGHLYAYLLEAGWLVPLTPANRPR